MGAKAETVVCVVGAPRSGTSLTAHILNVCGLFLGDADELVPPGPGNEAGFWELRRMSRLNEQVLQAMGRNDVSAPYPAPLGWEKSVNLDPQRDEARRLIADVFGGHGVWGWKDPRSSFTLPFWRQVLPQMRCVICLRNPLDVAASGTLFAAHRGADMPPKRLFALWERYIASAIVNTNGTPRLFVSYESFFDDWQGAASGLARFAGLDSPTETGREEEIGALIDSDLRHHWAPGGNLQAGELPASTRSLYSAVQELIASPDSGTEGIERLARDILIERTTA